MLKRHCMRSRAYMCIHCAVHCFAHHDIWHGWPSTTATEGCLPCFCLHTCMCSNSIASFGCCSMYIEQQALLFVAQLYAHIGTRLWALLFYAICCVHRLLAHACKSWAYLKTKVGTRNTVFWIWYIYIYLSSVLFRLQVFTWKPGCQGTFAICSSRVCKHALFVAWWLYTASRQLQPYVFHIDISPPSGNKTETSWF